VLLADYTSDAERGYAVGLRATINQVSSAGAPLLAGVFADALGMKPAFYLTGIILLGSTIWLYRVLQRAQQTRRAAAALAARQPAT
jgi:sugar phosphate permease